MSRDYKTPAKNHSRKNGNPLLLGMVIGLLLGLGIALGVAFFIKSSPSPFIERNKPESDAKSETPEAADAGKPAEGKSPGKPRFDFYTILPGVEEPVTEQEIKQAAQAPQNESKDNYFLQLGSFQSSLDADNLKAKLALLGVEAGIQTADLPGKGVWHRVRVGPFNDVEDLNRTRALLAQNGIPATPLKVREPAGH